MALRSKFRLQSFIMTDAVKIERPTLSRHTVRLRHHIRVRYLRDHSIPLFLKRTIAAQIHAWAALASFGAVMALLGLSYSHGWQHLIFSAVFGASAIMLFCSSALMHFFTQGYRISRRFERVLENLDKVCIHVLIAGTYTAIIGLALQEPLRSQMLTMIWILAVIGILYTVFYSRLPKWLQSRLLYTAQFLALGWLCLLFINEIVASFSPAQISLCFIGGGLYSIGAVIYVVQRPNPTRHFGYHEIWHSLVALGCMSFFWVVLLHYL
jgi:hemolysin III